jgi:hypothetical protein
MKHSAADWKKKALEAADTDELTLPSGMVVTARRPDPFQLATFGILPLKLTESAMPEVQTSPKPQLQEAVDEISVMRDLLAYCLVEPRLSMNPQSDEEIRPRDIPNGDWQYILRWAMRLGEAEKLAPFRRERPGGVTGGNGEVVELSTIAAPGDSGSGPSAER